MKTFLITAIVGSILATIIVKAIVFSAGTKPNPPGNQNTQTRSQSRYESQQRVAGAVTVDAEVLELAAGKPPKFSLKFNTHSEELSFEVDKVATLTDQTGKSYTGATWEGDPPGGHHRSGTLTFSAPLPSLAKLVTLSFKNPPVEFSWNINQ